VNRANRGTMGLSGTDWDGFRSTRNVEGYWGDETRQILEKDAKLRRQKARRSGALSMGILVCSSKLYSGW